MRRRLPLLLLLASAMTCLASLYLPWETAPRVPVAPTGWESSFGQAAGLLALALAAGAAAALARPRLETRLPLARSAFLLGYLGLSVWAELRALGMYEQSALAHESVRYGSGAYLGVAGALVAVLAAQVLRRDEFARPPSLPGAAGTLLTLGLLAAFILPLLRPHVPSHSGAFAFEIAHPGPTATAFAAGVALFGVPFWTDPRRTRERLAVAVATAVLTGGSLSLTGGRWTSYSWLALGCSLALLALAAAESSGLRLAVPPWVALTTAAAAVLLIAALFLPWQHECYSSSCYSASGWTLSFSALAGGLAILLVTLLVVAAGAFGAELALAVAVLLLASGFVLTEYTSLAYGAVLGFAGAAGMLLPLGAAPRPVPAEGRYLRLAAVAVCLGFLAIAVVPLTGRLSPRLELEAPWRLLWLQMAAVLGALRLLGRWLTGPLGDGELVLLPLALLALTALDLVYTRGQGLGWGGGLAVGLCLLLLLLGEGGRRGSLRVPEVLRIDRLPGES